MRDSQRRGCESPIRRRVSRHVARSLTGKETQDGNDGVPRGTPSCWQKPVIWTVRRKRVRINTLPAVSLYRAGLRRRAEAQGVATDGQSGRKVADAHKHGVRSRHSQAQMDRAAKALGGYHVGNSRSVVGSSMKPTIIMDGQIDVAILQSLLPPELLSSCKLMPIGPRSSLVSVARTYLIKHNAPTAVMLDTDTLDPTIIAERIQTTRYLMGAVAGGPRSPSSTVSRTSRRFSLKTPVRFSGFFRGSITSSSMNSPRLSRKTSSMFFSGRVADPRACAPSWSS